MSKYSIKDIERFSGIKAHTIRVWEKRYKIIVPKRTDTNIRYYTDEDLKKILNISLINKHGLKISKIALLSDEELKARVLQISKNNQDNLTVYIDNLVYAMVDLSEERVEKNLSSLFLKFGFEDSIIKIVYPLFETIGLLWQAGTISPIQEHFITNIIRQKIIVAIDSIIPEYDNNSKTFSLFLPDGENHEIGLLFYSYLIKKRNHRVFYFGQSAPLEALLETNSIRSSDFYVSSIVSGSIDNNTQNYFIKLSEALGSKPIIIGGRLSGSFDFISQNNITTVSNIRQFIDVIDSFA